MADVLSRRAGTKNKLGGKRGTEDAEYETSKASSGRSMEMGCPLPITLHPAQNQFGAFLRLQEAAGGKDSRNLVV